MNIFLENFFFTKILTKLDNNLSLIFNFLNAHKI